MIVINPSPTSSLVAQVDRIINGSFPSLNLVDDSPSIEDDEPVKIRIPAVGTRDSFRRAPQQQQSSTSDSTTTRKYAEHTNERLVALGRESTEDYKLIVQELNRRCAGTSIGYLSQPQLSTLCEYYASSRLLQYDELVRQHSQLQLDVQQSIDHDCFEILSVPTDKLLHLAALTLCLQNAMKYQ